MTKDEFLNCLDTHQLQKYDYSCVPTILTWKNKKIKIFCRICDEYFEQNFYSHKNGNGCRKCQYKKLAEERKLTFENFVIKAVSVHGGLYSYSNEMNYSSMNSKLKLFCNSCETYFIQRAGNHLMGHGCPNKKCIGDKISEKRKIPLVEFKNKSIDIFGDVFEYTDYKIKHGYITIRCLECNHIFIRTGRDHLHSLGCPNCSIDKSLGEKTIREYLDKCNIVYAREKTFPDLRGTSKYAILKCDFYLPDLNTVIEFDGIHHYEYFSFSSNKNISDIDKINEMHRRMVNDKIKDDYCYSNGIKIIRIKYTENIEERLNAEFK